MHKKIYFFLYIIYLPIENTQDCLSLATKNDKYLTAANTSSAYFWAKQDQNKAIFLNLNLIQFLINIFLIKIIKLKTIKNYNNFLLKLDFNLEELDFFIKTLNTEFILTEKNLNYSSELFLKISLTFFSLNNLIFMNSRPILTEKYELNVFASFIINFLNTLQLKLKKEFLNLELNIKYLAYIMINLKKIIEINPIVAVNAETYNLLFYIYFLKKDFNTTLNYFIKIIKNLNLILNAKTKALNKLTPKLKEKLLLEYQQNDCFTNNVDELKEILLNNTDFLQKNNVFLNEKLNDFISKKNFIFLKKVCSLHLIFISEYSFLLLKVNLFYENKYIVEYGMRYWSNTALNLIKLKSVFFEKVLINTNLKNLEEASELNALKSYYFLKKNFYIKKNQNSNTSSIFNQNFLNSLNQKFLKKVYWIDKKVFLLIFNTFELFLLKMQELNIDLSLKTVIEHFNLQILKINNFNFFNLENYFNDEKNKYDIFFSLIYLHANAYSKYIANVILKTKFLLFFFSEDTIFIMQEFITKELSILNVALISKKNFENFEIIIKTIKNLNLFLNNTYEVNVHDISKNKYTTSFFTEIFYFEYIFFIKNLKKLISYSEQIITIQNIKKKIINNTTEKTFGIEFKLDFRGRIYALDLYKAYDNSKLIRNSIKLKNSLNLALLKTWYFFIWNTNNIHTISDLHAETYDWLFTKEPFIKFKYLKDKKLSMLNNSEFLELLYLKSFNSILMYIGFLILKKSIKKTYNFLEIIYLGYDYFFNKKELTTMLTIEETIELQETENSLTKLLTTLTLEELFKHNKMLTLDSSCNGYTHLLYAFSELEEFQFNHYLKVLNLTSSKINYDFYSEVLNEISAFDENLKECIIDGSLSRTTIKKVVMTIPYNAKEFSFKKNLEQNLLIDNQEKKKKNFKFIKNLFF